MIIRGYNRFIQCDPRAILARPWEYELIPNDPLMNQLVFFCTMGNHVIGNFAPNGQFFQTFIGAGINLAPTPWGSAWTFSSSQVFTPGNLPNVTTSSNDGLGDFSLGVIAGPASSASNRALMIYQRLGSGGNNTLGMGANADKSFTLAQGKYAFLTAAGGTFSGAETANTVVDGTVKGFVGRRIGTAHSIWVDYADATAASDTTNRDVYASAAPMNFSGGSGGTSGANGPIVAVAGWNIGLTDDLCQRFATAWHLSFRPRVFVYPVKVSTPPPAAGVAGYRSLLGVGV